MKPGLFYKIFVKTHGSYVKIERIVENSLYTIWIFILPQFYFILETVVMFIFLLLLLHSCTSKFVVCIKSTTTTRHIIRMANHNSSTGFLAEHENVD